MTLSVFPLTNTHVRDREHGRIDNEQIALARPTDALVHGSEIHMTATELPDQGVVFWPVGTGDSTTIVVDGRHVLQVDLRDQKAATADGAVVTAVIDRLAETLPTTSGGTDRISRSSR